MLSGWKKNEENEAVFLQTEGERKNAAFGFVRLSG